MTTNEAQLEPSPYGCFLHPSKGFKLRMLSDLCPECNKPYSFPLDAPPLTIREYSIVRPLGRGFYSVIYLATRGPLKRQYVLKVVPVAVYAFHSKDFPRECSLHLELATGTDHVVDIHDYFDEDVDFGGLRLLCHVAVMDYVAGSDLIDFLRDRPVRARTIAQMAIDLFRLLRILEQKSLYHNDLHHRNLLVEELPQTRHRPEAVDETIRLVAVDLGSLADGSRSGPPRQALGDLTSVAKFLFEFAAPLLSKPEESADSDYRLASTLRELSSLIAGKTANLRAPDYEDFIDQIRTAYLAASSPWRPPPGLRQISDAYNAQTLHPAFVAKLLVDPGGEWLGSISTGGPQVITGVRGCGKTMLLRALEFHARLAGHSEGAKKPGALVELVREDGYVGLYVSARRLLDAVATDGTAVVLHEPYARLALAYARQAVRAAVHFAEVEPGSLRPRWWQTIGRVASEIIAEADGAGLSSAISPEVLDRRLQAALLSLDRAESRYRLVTNPALAFPALAEAVRTCSAAWAQSKVLFLLDDVSTRHLREQSIAELLGTLLFSDDTCAFKLTTEGQTLELALKSPGLIEPARPDRDYEPFDLAARVNEKLKHPQEGKHFLAQILKLRADQFRNHPPAHPQELLADRTLEEIARHIVATGKTAGERKKTYWGLTALTAVCVGDIGDVLMIYDSMLRKFNYAREGAIPPAVQNEAFQEYSSRRLYHLNRRRGDLKDYAMSFAEAAHDLLLRSARRGRGAAGNRDRLRQYAQIYVRITGGDEQKQFERLRELIDAGVFVLESGADAPRQKARDSDPISQFILTYRKLFGLTNHIGLAFSDRFELSGEQLRRWLFEPERGKEILMEKLGGPLSANEAVAADLQPRPEITAPPFRESQMSLRVADDGDEASDPGMAIDDSGWPAFEQVLPLIEELNEKLLPPVQTLFLGLGFERRSLASAERLLGEKLESLEHIVLVKYEDAGFADEITKLARQRGVTISYLTYSSPASFISELPAGAVAVDVTGLAKPVLFNLVRSALQDRKRVVVVHTQAEEYYPLDEDIEPIFAEIEGQADYQILERASNIWLGEMTPYSFVPLIRSEPDDARRRLLSAAAAAKHERLLSLMEERGYDAVDILVPASESPRAKLARLAAEVASRGTEMAEVERLDSNDLQAIFSRLAAQFRRYYLELGYSVEYGLTGSKMHAVACAAASSVLKLAQVWYVAPASFDSNRFTRGVGPTRYFSITLPS